jgi:hypothetical protein
MDKEGLRETAIHEAAHACLAHHYGWQVICLRASAWHDGITYWVAPMAPLDLQRLYRTNPARTRQYLVQTLATLIAPSVTLGLPVEGGDERDLHTWQYVYERTRHAYGDPPFDDLVRQAWVEVALWLADPTHTRQLAMVAGTLAHRRYLSGADFLALVAPPKPVRPAVTTKPAPAPAVHRSAPVSQAPRAAQPKSTPKATPKKAQGQPLQPEDILWDYSRTFGRGLGLARW